LSATQDKLQEIAQTVLAMDESELLRLLPIYQKRVEDFSSMSEWDEAVILYFLINAYRIRNIQFSQKVNQFKSKQKKDAKGKKAPSSKEDNPERTIPSLSLVK
jgi:hypothetical protein